MLFGAYGKVGTACYHITLVLQVVKLQSALNCWSQCADMLHSKLVQAAALLSVFQPQMAHSPPSGYLTHLSSP